MGRLQDADENDYYENLCKRAGIKVHYSAEQFENEGVPTSTIGNSVKRAMASYILVRDSAEDAKEFKG